MKVAWRGAIAPIFTGGVLYLWLGWGVFIATGFVFSSMMHPFLFWGIILFWFLTLLVILSLSDYFCYQAIDPLNNVSAREWISYLFMKRLFWCFLMAIPLLILAFIFIPIGIFLLPHFFSQLWGQVVLICFIILYGGVLQIRCLFVDYFLLKEEKNSILQALWKSFCYCNHQQTIIVFKENAGKFIFLWGGILLLFLLPVYSLTFWIFLLIFVAGTRIQSYQLKLWGYRHWQTLMNV